MSALTANAFIDLVRVVIRCPHEEPIGVFSNRGLYLPTGEMVREKLSHVNVRGPHDNAQVRTHDPWSRQMLEIKLCPGKYFNGHNAFCSGHLRDLVVDGVLDVIQRLGLVLPDRELERLRTGDIDLHEIHCTAMLGLRSDVAVRNAVAYIYYQGKIASLKYGPGKFPGTPTFGTARNYQVKFYNKFLEMTVKSDWGHGLSDACKEELLAWTQGLLRVEVCLQRRKLKQLFLEKAYSWSDDTPGIIVRQQLAKVRVNERPGLSPEEKNTLTTGEYRIYELWESNVDLKKAYRSSGTRGEYRRRLLPRGIDISIPYADWEASAQTPYDVVPFSQIIHLPFEPIPDIVLPREEIDDRPISMNMTTRTS